MLSIVEVRDSGPCSVLLITKGHYKHGSDIITQKKPELHLEFVSMVRAKRKKRNEALVVFPSCGKCPPCCSSVD